MNDPALDQLKARVAAAVLGPEAQEIGTVTEIAVTPSVDGGDASSGESAVHAGSSNATHGASHHA